LSVKRAFGDGRRIDTGDRYNSQLRCVCQLRRIWLVEGYRPCDVRGKASATVGCIAIASLDSDVPR
jgi:hypothetical protein